MPELEETPDMFPEIPSDSKDPDSGNFYACYICGGSFQNYPESAIVRDFTEYEDGGTKRSFIISMCSDCKKLVSETA